MSLRRLATWLASWDAIGGLAVVAIGAFVMWEASHYPMGELRRMGPGYFPMLLGAVLAGLGAFIMAEGLRPAGVEDSGLAFRPSWRPVLSITASLIAFAALLETVGLAPATLALVLIAALADRTYRPVTAIATAAVMAAAMVLTFIYGFKMPLQAFG